MALYQMSPEHKGKLQGNRVYLIENIEPSERLLSYLLQERVLTEDMYEEIDVRITKFMQHYHISELFNFEYCNLLCVTRTRV